MRELELSPIPFECKQGDVLIWHGSLLHGGAPRRAERLTRKSFVVHYSTASQYRSRHASMKARVSADDNGFRNVGARTERVLVSGSRHGLDNPLRGVTPQAATTRT
jgi:ectoine hydroxylase-related dioxygenase (phytanoyl-CoA dioxygenase family)